MSAATRRGSSTRATMSDARLPPTSGRKPARNRSPARETTAIAKSPSGRLRRKKPPASSRSQARFLARMLPGAKAGPMPEFIDPCLATLKEQAPAGPRLLNVGLTDQARGCGSVTLQASQSSKIKPGLSRKRGRALKEDGACPEPPSNNENRHPPGVLASLPKRWWEMSTNARRHAN
jgi:hypothetical protein